MRQFSMATIGGSHGSPFLFSNPVQVQGGPSLGGLFDWYSDAQYYNMAKAAVASFDQLKERVVRIADKAARDKIIGQYAMTTDSPGTGLSYRNLVAGWVGKADASGDPGDGFADDGKHGRKNTDTLSSFVGNISGDVQDAELKYGLLQAPSAPAAAPSAPAAPAGMNWTIPVVAVGGGLVLAVVLGAFKK